MTAAITDFNQFAALRRDADTNDPAVLREVAGQFEALFLQTIMKSMRDASLGDPIFGDSHSHEMYQGMLDRQLAMELASGDGIGLAEMLVRQLGGETPPTSAVTHGIAAARVRGDRQSAGWSDAESFARDVWPHAQRVARRLNVAPEGILAQAALETGWGKHVAETRDGASSNNLFGIKNGNGWQGDSVTKRTIEYDGNTAERRTAQFRAYADVATTFDDYYDFLSSNPRYAGVRDHGNDIAGFAGALANSGYATDPAYAEKIERVAASATMQRVLTVLKHDAAPSITQ